MTPSVPGSSYAAWEILVSCSGLWLLGRAGGTKVRKLAVLMDVNQSLWDNHAGIAELHLYHLQDLNYLTPSHLGFSLGFKWRL